VEEGGEVMTDDPVEQALAELQDLVKCRCHPAYTGRGLRDPDCECDSAEALKVLADRIEAQAAEIERLEKACAEWAEVSQSNYQRAKSAEAKLAMALEAGKTMDDGCDCERCNKARATLAELKGQDDD
jgi:hypothetical protein